MTAADGLGVDGLGADGLERARAAVAASSRWTTLEHHGEVTSTNDVVRGRHGSGSATGLVVVADRQVAGRGRRGRVWEDRPGGSLLVSFALAAPVAGPATLVPLAAGLAVVDAVAARGVTARLKWPNDVLAGGTPERDGRKCAGILVERHEPPERGAVLVVGVGVDVDWRDAPSAAWTSLAECTGGAVDRWTVLADLVAALDTHLDDLETHPSRLLDRYRAVSATLGRRVEVATASERFTGLATDVTATGALVVALADGRRRTVTAGDLGHLRSPPG